MLRKAMGVSVRRTCRVEGCRDETRTIKTNSPRRAEKHQRKPARLSWLSVGAAQSAPGGLPARLKKARDRSPRA